MCNYYLFVGMKSGVLKEQAKHQPGNITMRSMNCSDHTMTSRWICRIWMKATSQIQLQSVNRTFLVFNVIKFGNYCLDLRFTSLEDEVVSIGDSGSDNDTDENRHSSGESQNTKNGYDHPTKKLKMVINRCTNGQK